MPFKIIVVLRLRVLKGQCHPKCFAPRGTFFMYEKSAIFLIVVKSDLYLLPSLPLTIRKHQCEFWLDISLHISEFWSVFAVEKEIFKLDASYGSGKIAEGKAESSALCQSCTAEGVRLSVAERKKNVYGFQQQYWHCVRRNSATFVADENRKNVNLPQNNSSYGPAPK